MTWIVSFYNRSVEQETLKLPPGILASFLRITELIEEFGPDLGRPHTAPLGRGLFEIRSKGQEGIARSLFCTVKNREVVVLVTVIKKGNKIAKRYLELARKRMREIHDE